MIDELPEAQKVSYGKGYRICRDYGLLTKRCPKSITKADPKASKAEDLVKRNFSANAPGINVFTDITQMLCSDGKLFCHTKKRAYLQASTLGHDKGAGASKDIRMG